MLECDKIEYNVGMYLRLSKEDENDKQSESIINQREIITKYILDNNWNLYDEYIDDGYTGTNFDRPDFKRMIEDIEKGKINVVIVKDYSRLGRNYVRTGMLLDEFFPIHNVRFIAINDGIDTFKINSNNELSGFKGIMNDMYSADISRKIRSTLNSKRSNGQFIGAFAPYGYKKDSSNKNKLAIDEEASLIVKRIFNMRLNGIGNEEIVRVLNKEKVLSPIEYKQKKDLNYRNSNIYPGWRAETIKDILSNPTYIGNLAQGKSERISYKVRKSRKIPKDRWIIVENTHNPIVDKKTFDTVQILIKKKSYGRTENKTEHLLGGILICGDCGFPITFRRENRKGEKVFITLCSNYSRFHRCKRHAVLEKGVNNLVINDLKKICESVITNKENFYQSIKRPIFKHDNNLNKLIREKKVRTQEILKLKKGLYEDWKKSCITKEDFENMYREFSKEKEELDNEIKSLQNQDKSTKNDNNLDELKLIVDFEIIPKQILINLIDKIELFQNRDVRIYYKFLNPFSQ